MKCFYCERDGLEARDVERDHFPIPARAGGVVRVVACRKCHNAKDRVRDGDIEDMVTQELKWSGEHVLWLQKDFLDAAETPEIAVRVLRRIWPALPLSLRIYDARVLAYKFDNAFRRGAA